MQHEIVERQEEAPPGLPGLGLVAFLPRNSQHFACGFFREIFYEPIIFCSRFFVLLIPIALITRVSADSCKFLASTRGEKDGRCIMNSYF